MWQGLIRTISYITIIPLAKPTENLESISGLAKFLPAAGLLIGLVLSSACTIMQSLSVPIPIQALLLTIAWIGITGGIHLDGLMDTTDGLCSHRDRNRMLEIMRDSRVGNFGAICGTLIVLAKLISIAYILPTELPILLLLIPSWARWTELLAMASYPYARSEGMGKIWQSTTKPLADPLLGLTLPLFFTLVTTIYCGSPNAWLAVISCVSAGVLFSSYCNAKLGGQTGDTYGATVELSEATALLVVASLAKTLS